MLNVEQHLLLQKGIQMKKLNRLLNALSCELENEAAQKKPV